MTVHVCKVDRSPETGSLVVCTCGFALGPFRDKSLATEAARAHRRAHVEPVRPGQSEQKRRSA